MRTKRTALGRSLSALAVAAGIAIAAHAAAATLEVPEGVEDAAAASRPGERFIVVFAPGVADPDVAARALLHANGGTLLLVYRHALSGFAAELPAPAVEALSRHPLVASVEADQVMHTTAQLLPTGIRRIFADGNAAIDIDGADDFRVDVDIASIDTGVDFDHPDLNVVARTDCTAGNFMFPRCADGSGDDGNGHGSHTAGTMAALDNGIGVVGVAPGARIHAVKVLGDSGSGWTSEIIAGVDWVTKHASTIEVANMSLGGGNSATLCSAIDKSFAAGVVYAVAAGNEDVDASGSSPANCASVITVSALADFDGLPGGGGAATCRTDQDDTLADFSNWGSTVEITAPGVCIDSTYKDGGYAVMSGTSMASPHVAGAAALLRSAGMKAADVRKALLDNGNLSWTDDSGDGVKEPLLGVAAAVFTPKLVATGAPPDTTAPIVSAVTVSSVTAVSATITWTTNEPADSVVIYGPAGGPTTQLSSSALVTSHSVLLTGLAPDTAYDFEVRSTDAAGNPATPSTGSFTTGAASQSIVLTNAPPYLAKSGWRVPLAWSGATPSVAVDLYRDSRAIASVTTATGSGTYEDNVGKKASGKTYTYQACQNARSVCSAPVIVQIP